MKVKALCILVLLLFGAILASAQTITRCGGPTNALYIDSPMFHFDVCRTGNNPYEHILGPSTVGGLVVDWMYQTGASVYSSPALVNGVIYFGSGDGNVYALNATTGALIWMYATGGAVYSSPAVANGVVYVGSSTKDFFALNANTGALLWKYSVTDANGILSSPVVADGIVTFTSRYHVWALDARTGALIWQQKADGALSGNASPAVVNGVFVRLLTVAKARNGNQLLARWPG